MKSTKTFIIMILFVAGMSSNLFANSFADTYGFSAEGIARGNAMTATVNDWSSVYYNVAGLGRTAETTGTALAGGGEMTLKLRKTEGEAETEKEKFPNQFAFGLLYTIPKLNLNIKRYSRSASGDFYPIDTDAAKMNPYGFITIGGVLDLNNVVQLPDFISSARLGLGMGLNADLSLVKVNDIDPRTHNFLRYGREVQRAMILIGAGLGFLNDAFGGGIGANLAFAGKGKVYMEAELTADPVIPVQQATMDLTVAPGVIAGIYLSPLKLFNVGNFNLDLGASYRMETMLKIDPFDAAAGILGGVLNMNLMLAIFDYYSPHVVTGGIAFGFYGITLSADLDLQMWSKTEVGKSLKVNFIGLPEFVDILVPKVGVKYDTPLKWLAVMVGYSYTPSIVSGKLGKLKGLDVRMGPASTKYTFGMFNYLDNNKHTASLGLKFTVPKVWRLGGQIVVVTSYQFQYLVDKTVNRWGLVWEPPITTNEYFLNPNYSYGGMNHSVFVEIGMRL
ncbi:MAG: hypothetical protein JW807_06000 [Spirochaetes bacterium]|nr:hypothetical protein [Spirochaetota bacterium]